METIDLREPLGESELFTSHVQSGEFTFLAQDARGLDGTIEAIGAVKDQTQKTLSHLDAALGRTGQSLDDLVSLSVFLPEYAEAADVAQILRSTFTSNYPAVNFVGVCGLDGNCRVRMDAIATTSRDRETITIPNLPLSLGAGCHGVCVGEFAFLAGVDAADHKGQVSLPATIQSQTTEVLTRIGKILSQQDLGLRNLCRTFMFMPGTQHRPGYGEARKEIYKEVFAEDEFPPNSGIYVGSLGGDILLRSMAIAHRGKQTIVTSPKVRKAPGSFSQSARVGDWLLLAGQDAVGFDRAVEAEGSLAGQTEVTLRHTKDIVESAGGTLDDIVKTTVYLTEGTNRAEFAAAYRKFFEMHYRKPTLPTGLIIEVRELSPRCLVEIDSVAFLGRE
jgi:2-iminobutanoate/2-iminopropanoate deaminase